MKAFISNLLVPSSLAAAMFPAVAHAIEIKTPAATIPQVNVPHVTTPQVNTRVLTPKVNTTVVPPSLKGSVLNSSRGLQQNNISNTPTGGY